MQRQMNLRLPNQTVFRRLKAIAAVVAMASRVGIGIERHHTGRVARQGQSICLSHRSHVYPNVAKVGGLQSQGDKGAAVVDLLQALGNAGSCVLRLLQHWGIHIE